MGGHNEHQSDASVASKVAGLPKWAGRAVLEQAVLLWLVLRDPAVPPWAKAIVAAALAYFVSPIDAIPDPLFPVGFTDDGAVMAGAIVQLGAHVTNEHRIPQLRAPRLPRLTRPPSASAVEKLLRRSRSKATSSNTRPQPPRERFSHSTLLVPPPPARVYSRIPFHAPGYTP